MHIAYIISAYRSPHQLLRLISRIQGRETTVLVHVDKKSGDEIMNPIASALSGTPNVHLLERHVCHWGDFGHVAASLKGIRFIVERRVKCDRVVLLTGQDYPIKSNAAIRDFFAAHSDREFIEHFPLPRADWYRGGMPRLEHWHLWLGGRHIELPKDEAHPGHEGPVQLLVNKVLPRRRPVPGDRRPYGGGGYWSLTRAAVEYLHQVLQEEPAYTRFFRRVYIPDEIFFQTLLLNAPLQDRVVNDDLRYTVWRDGAQSPAVLAVDDLDDLATSHGLFARKFDTGVDARVLDLIDDALL
ncbi:core-2/I-Branching enzyme [Geodermatophilus tzadiensis]|uniref:Peptide O-xylosyltransferase n=1 Tax=Geodermatophilus tzadiensis TaxID=1137988 RepID=A0A2T0TR64_9ACTN|nr:beta-1,6-N-acetylglucosaminyltransferase [Geodermatophilus tzadiensis]PRY48131.1 core-2/I-Branching enzyme [Geodermatophilus tzadiensis]